MKTALRIGFALALSVLAVWLWTVLFPSPEKVIRRRLLELARTVSTPGNESDLARLAAAHGVAGFFSTNIELNIESPRYGRQNLTDREEITQAVYYARSRPGGVQVTFPDITVTVAPDRQSAEAHLTVEARLGTDPDATVQQMKFNLRLVDGRWLITRVETVRTLSRRPPVRSGILNFALRQAPFIVRA
ncbi:MAG TPA: hypothetical protein VMB80_03495 [Candidatus Acidoferrum sp.]|nr:hypothetical protein [Candidatus Acidoferrum sp.]